jgi:molybdenum cofactor cytidylyltransferase
MHYADAVMILPGDTALIKSNAIDAVIEGYTSSKRPVVVAAHRGKLGHPILLDRSLFGEIMKINEKTRGLKAVVNAHRDLTTSVEASSDEVLIDVDTKEDLHKKVLKRVLEN